MKFKINKTNKTASLFKINSKQIEHLIVPRTVKHVSHEYLVTSICYLGGSTSTIKFEENSSVNTIYQFALADSNVEEIYFQISLTRFCIVFWFKKLEEIYNFTIKSSISIQRQ